MEKGPRRQRARREKLGRACMVIGDRVVGWM